MMGIYPTLNYINHSCRHNATLRTPGAEPATLHLIATRNIRAGDELAISYSCFGVLNEQGKVVRELQMAAAVPSTRDRRHLLIEQYGFVCQCAFCVANSNT